MSSLVCKPKFITIPSNLSPLLHLPPEDLKILLSQSSLLKLTVIFKALHAERKGLFFEVGVLCCHANVTKRLLDETHSHPALALAQAAPSWPLTHGDSPAVAGAPRLR